jgi:methylmalonyl-CoA mutase N-terminal domain/subunit
MEAFLITVLEGEGNRVTEKSFETLYREWQEKTRELLQKYPEQKERYETLSGIEVDRVYIPDAPGERERDAIGLPGEYPFTRGIRPTMYRSRLWTMRQYAGFGSAEETNRRFRYLLDEGQTGLSVAFDLPTQIGYDSDDPMAAGEVGKVGVAIDSLADMEKLLQGIPLDRVSTSMTINAPAAVLLAMYIAVGEKQGVPSHRLTGTIQNDILKEYIARGTYIFPPQPSMRLITDVFAFCGEHVPRWNTISISGYHIREAGSTAVQEVAFTLADGIAYVEAAKRAGLDVDRFAPRLSFFFNAHNHFFEEVAKFRAARRLWARIMKERFGAKDPRSMQLRFHTQTGGSTLTAQQPDNNVVRVTLQALAAVLGGTQSLHTNARDEALALPTEESARIALRTQQILAYESGVTHTVDPLGGSWFVESLTDAIEQEAQAYMERIDELGGAVAAVEQGYMQREIHQAALDTQRKIESGEEVVVGVNRFRLEQEEEPEIYRLDPALARKQVESLQALRKRRDQGRVQETLQRLKQGAAGSDNLMPLILDAVRVYATVGEICHALREVFGEYQPIN